MKLQSLFRPVAMLSATFILAACNNHDAVKTANAENSQMEDSMKVAPVNEQDSKFLTAATSGGMMEVELGNLAQQQGYNKRVKAFGEMMVNDHSKANRELKELAATKQVTLPYEMSNEHKNKVEELKKKNGREFDKAYMDLMVDDHKEDVEAFRKSANEAIDSDIRGFAGRTLPTLQTHLDSAKAIQQDLK